jgi:hypothetical protein
MMSALGSRSKRTVVAVLAAATLASVVPAVAVEAVVRPDTLYHEAPPSSGPVVPGFPIDHVGVVVPLPPSGPGTPDHAHDLEGLAVRFRTTGTWGPWQPLPEDGAQAEGTWTSGLVAAGDAVAYQLRGLPAWARGVRVAALNTTDGPLRRVGSRPSASADALTNCRARIDWGADESLRTSSRSYATIRVVTVHHTATANGASDPAATVRAIYHYHVVTNGWADIGYQALIAEDGIVYEGRWSGTDSPSCRSGGTTLPFGHQTTSATSAIVTAAHVGGWNTGNLGVALLGTLTSVDPAPAARASLVAYLAEIGRRHGLDMTGTVTLTSGSETRTVQRISGHRDLAATECPGGRLYEQLPAIRLEAAAAVAGDRPPVVAIDSPATAASVTVVEDRTGAGASVTFRATVTDEDPANVRWSWTDGTGATVATTAQHVRVLAVGTHLMRVEVSDRYGQTDRDTIEVTVVAAPTATDTTDVATSQRTVTGTVTGTLADTHAADGRSQVLTETLGGGKPNSRTSQLEHHWTIDVTGGASVTLVVVATTSTSQDADAFELATSVDGGATFVTRLTLAPGTSGQRTLDLPADTRGPVIVRLRDTDRRPGATTLDVVTLDLLAIRSEVTAATPPAAPATVTTDVVSSKVVDVGWSAVAGASGSSVERSVAGATWTRVADLAAGITAWRDTDAPAESSMRYRVRSSGAGGTSAWTLGPTVTTPAPVAPTLTAIRTVVQRKHRVTLTWVAEGPVSVLRDDGTGWRIIAVSDGASHVDDLGNKPPSTLAYRVCLVDAPVVCSAVVTP